MKTVICLLGTFPPDAVRHLIIGNMLKIFKLTRCMIMSFYIFVPIKYISPMKKLLCIGLYLLALTYAKAGDDDKSSEKKRKFTFTASFGSNIALGAYGRKDSIPVHDTTHINGYSDLGFYFDISAGYQITDVIGLAVMLNGNFDDFNTVGYENAYEGNTAKPLAAGTVTTSGSYFLVQYLVGPYFEIPASANKLSKICIKLMAGSMHCNYPTISNMEGYSNTYTQSVTSGSGFSYRIYAGYEVYASEALRITFGAAYSGGNITYNSVTSTLSGPGVNYSYTSNSARIMSVGLIQISTGVVVML